MAATDLDRFSVSNKTPLSVPQHPPLPPAGIRTRAEAVCALAFARRWKELDGFGAARPLPWWIGGIGWVKWREEA